MKKRNIYIISIILLISIGASCTSNSALIGEKECSELENSVEEFKEGKSIFGFTLETNFFGLSRNPFLVFRSFTHSNYSFNSASIYSGTIEKYLLHCSLKLYA